MAPAMKLFIVLALCSTYLFLITSASLSEKEWGVADIKQNRHRPVQNEIMANGTANNGASCYDSRLSGYINTALSYYSHDMNQLTKYILDQIVRARYSGSWLVHAQQISNTRQGPDWQSATNGDLFQPNSRHGCYYHDTYTYIIILKY